MSQLAPICETCYRAHCVSSCETGETSLGVILYLELLHRTSGVYLRKAYCNEIWKCISSSAEYHLMTSQVSNNMAVVCCMALPLLQVKSSHLSHLHTHFVRTLIDPNAFPSYCTWPYPNPAKRWTLTQWKRTRLMEPHKSRPVMSLTLSTHNTCFLLAVLSSSPNQQCNMFCSCDSTDSQLPYLFLSHYFIMIYWSRT